jgi:hypothetical protein
MAAREVTMNARARTLALALPLLCCAPPKTTPPAAAPSGATFVPAAPSAPAVEVVAVREVAPRGGDGAPRLTLAFRFADGTRTAIGQATAYAPFRQGVALVDVQGRLVLVAPDGARSVLALVSGAPPARGPRGELAYVARHGLAAEVHVLDGDGRDRIVARGLGSAGVLAPQPDGRLFFVATRRGGGIAGLWLADDASGSARCLTNCALTTGAPLDDRFVPLPRDASSIHASEGRVEWDATDGTRRSVVLVPGLPGETGGALHDRPERSAP